ncbi:MAG: maltose/maltodextrin ABC transporter substrate-binding protein MalE, partial [Microvirga sp.]
MIEARKAFCLGMLAGLLAAAPSFARAREPLQLLVWINGDKGYNGLQKVGDRFTAESGVRVVVQHPEGAPDKFQSSTGAGKGPDIFCWPHDRVGEWARSGLIVPVYPRQKLRDTIEPSAWQAFEYKGKTWGYPLAIEAVGLIYNKKLVPVPPKDFAEIPAIDAKLQAQGKHALLWDYGKSFFTFPMLAAGGGYTYGRDAKGNFDVHDIGVNNAGAIAGAQVLLDLIEHGQMPRGAKYAEMESAFAQGATGMMISGPWAWDNAKKAHVDFGVAPYPDVNGRPSRPFVGVLGCMVTAPSRNKDLAREFIENYLLRIDSLKAINADVPLGTPANKAFYAELAADPNIRATMENARRGVAIPNIPETGKFWTAADAALEAITQGRQSPKAALDGAAARMRVR